MADFDLLQTDAQVQSILNDGQNMQGAGAQTTLTTESVLLKDVNGNYHKILKSYFTEAIRDTLADLLVNNDKGTTINQIAAIASGDFGSITPANLASVLGGRIGVVKMEQADGNTPFNIGKATGVIVVTTDGTRNSGVYTVDPNANPTIIKEFNAVTVTRSGTDSVITVTNEDQKSYKVKVYLLGMIKQ